MRHTKHTQEERTIEIRIGRRFITVRPMSENEVVKANQRIQKKVQPVVNQLKKTRRNASITASRIILNA